MPPDPLKVALAVPRPSSGAKLVWDGLGDAARVVWQSNGGVGRGHPAKALPYSFEIPCSKLGPISRIFLHGVLALYAEAQGEEPGTVGANIQALLGKETVFRQDLVNGRHYTDARDLRAIRLKPGDGTSLETVGKGELDGAAVRIDLLTVDLPPGLEFDKILFKDLSTPASFVIAQLEAEREPNHGCPFRSTSGGVPLSELGAVLRLGDRPRFERAMKQLQESICGAEDLDEARGQALTFLAVASAATLELGGAKSMHRIQLEAARCLDRCSSSDEVLDVACEFIRSVTQPVFAPSMDPAAKLVDKALTLVERNFARRISDSTVAEQLGLSTSHFRYLFRQTTGQPFHKYLISTRLEKARRLLVDSDMAVGSVAEAVGFAGVSHFSRAFTQKFSVSPTSVRRSAG